MNDWKWFDPVFTYDAGRLPISMLLAFNATGNRDYRAAGLESLDFLLKICFPGDGKRLSLVGNKTWLKRGGTSSLYDQQPIDAASIVEACAVAEKISGKKSYAEFAERAFNWFLGDNIEGIPVYDATSGGCHDGLVSGGVNPNEGGESTIMWMIARCTIGEMQKQANHE